MKQEKIFSMPSDVDLNRNGADYHVPVLLQEVLDGLAIKSSGVYVDCTFGGGGHSKAILERLGADGRLIVFDQDADARNNAPQDDRLIFVGENFRHLNKFLRLHKISAVDGLLADLGVSSHQFDKGERGFSIRYDANLDMRMDQRSSLTAADVLNEYDQVALHKMFEQYGEVTNAKSLARRIVEHRAITKWKTIAEFKLGVSELVKGNPNKYFAQVFQALRIEVNDEMGALNELLLQLNDVMHKEGRVCIITFHSLEDRLVKQFFKKGESEANRNEFLFGQKKMLSWKLITKKPIEAKEEELMKNPRSRSAKLRIAEKP